MEEAIMFPKLGCTVLGAFVLIATSAIPAAEPEWPTFKGNNSRTGTTSVPPIKAPKVLWKTEIGIQGYLNCPVLADGRVFVGSSGSKHNESDDKDGVYCLDAKTGKILWYFRTEEDACGLSYGNGIVFATGDDGVLRALSATDGKELWQTRREGELYCQPLVVKDRVLIGDMRGRVAAFDAKTGKAAWDVAVSDGGVRGGLSCAGDRIYATFTAARVACLDLDGKILWKRRISEWAEIYPAPVVAGERLLIGYARDTQYETPAFKALDAKTGAVLWEATSGKDMPDRYSNIRCTPAVWNDTLIYCEQYSNHLVAVDIKSGAALWQMELGARVFPHWPSPVLAGDVAYLPRHDGALYAVDLKTRKNLWQIYIGDVKQLGLKLPEGVVPEGDAVADDPAVGAALYATPALAADGTIYVGSGQGWLYAIGEDR
jgi:outer membrane protein assembly factor BamB